MSTTTTTTATFLVLILSTAAVSSQQQSPLDLSCTLDTFDRLFHSPSSPPCALCEILKARIGDLSHCQTNINNPSATPTVCFNTHHRPHSNNNSNVQQHQIHHHHSSSASLSASSSLVDVVTWEKSFVLNAENKQVPVFHVNVKRRRKGPNEEEEDEDDDNNNDRRIGRNNNKNNEDEEGRDDNNEDDEEDNVELLSLTFSSYPKILPRICAERRHPLRSPFGHLCPPNTKCTEESSESEGYTCLCQEECSRTWLLRKILEWIQIVCIVVCVILSLVVYWLRKTKVMNVAMWPITESILFGSILLYTSVILKIEIPTNTPMLCLFEPWTRELGFTLLYGGIILKIYRSLVEFRTRKAHRWVVREKDILRYLCTMTCVVVFYMTSWTVTNKYYSEEGEEFYDHLYCPVTWWHRVTEMGEVLFLCVGLNMAWHLRRAPVSPFRYFYTAALLIETTTNVIGIIIREGRYLFVDEEDEVFLMILHFVRCQLTTTVIILIVIAPKLYYIREEKRKRQLRRGDTTSSGIGAGRKALEAAINNGDLDFADINIADMDPQDIRAELKRMYTQLELLRNKTMRKDNPHISKRHGGRKPTHRRFSLQKKGSRDKALRRQQQAREMQSSGSHYHPGGGGSRGRSFRGYAHDDIEDSVCSIEGPSTYSEAGR